MADFIGYNPTEINTLMKEIADSYNKLGGYMADGWSQVSSTMQSNWKGVDEQDYEAKLAKRMNTLYDNTKQLVEATLDTIVSLGESWVDFQNKNRLQGGDGAVEVQNASISFEKPGLTEYEMSSIVKLNENTFEGENLGLQSGGGNAIKGAVDAYTQAIQSNVTGLYGNIDSNKAFIGSQGQNVNDFLVAVGDAVKALSTDVQDMYDALDTLTDTGYSTADTDAASSISGAKDQVSQAVSEIR